jgi:hypothetical protein
MSAISKKMESKYILNRKKWIENIKVKKIIPYHLSYRYLENAYYKILYKIIKGKVPGIPIKFFFKEIISINLLIIKIIIYVRS